MDFTTIFPVLLMEIFAGTRGFLHHLFTQNTLKTRKDVCYMAITFTNLNDLKMYIQAQIDSALVVDVKTEVAETAERVGRGVVYGAYQSPVMYGRRHGSGESLLDPENFSGEADNGVLTVKSTATPNYSYNGANDYTVKSLAELVEYGDGYKGQRYSFPVKEIKEPRPFMAETAEELESNNALKEALKNGLKRRGLTVK